MTSQFQRGDIVRERGRTRLLTVSKVEQTPIIRWIITENGVAYDYNRLILVKRAHEPENDKYQWLTKLNEEDDAINGV